MEQQHPRTPDTIPLPPLLVMAWREPVVDTVGFDPRSGYVEKYWLPMLGPTATWFLRRVAREFDREPDGFSLDAADCARSIGIGTRGGRNSPFERAIERCVRFGLARREHHGILAVRTRVPPLSKAQAQRLPRHLKRSHRRWQEDQLQHAHPADDHAVRLARSLLDVGASATDVEEQLERWNFDPPTSRRALAAARPEERAE